MTSANELLGVAKFTLACIRFGSSMATVAGAAMHSVATRHGLDERTSAGSVATALGVMIDGYATMECAGDFDKAVAQIKRLRDARRRANDACAAIAAEDDAT